MVSSSSGRLECLPGGFFCEGVSPKKSLAKIGEPSHTRRFASDRGEFSPNGVAILDFGSGRVSSGRPKTDLGPVLAKALKPANRRTGADLELFGRSTSGSPSFHEVNDAHSQLTRIRSMHYWPALQRINKKLSLVHICRAWQREEKLTVPPIPIRKKESRSQSEQQSDKTASETDKNVEPGGSEGKGENNGGYHLFD
jgi:hypothetical protein